ncbi:MAG: hypothetical protein R3F49_07965 [Planctomycetota bacterium]
MLRLLTPLLLATSLVAPGWAQVTDHAGPSPNLTGPALTFDHPNTILGPVSPGQLQPYGIRQVALVGNGWQPAGSSFVTETVTGIALYSKAGQLQAQYFLGPPPDGPGAGDGWDIELDAPVDEFQFTFSGQWEFSYEVELSLAGVSLGSATFFYPRPYGSRYVRATGSKFDRVRITFPNALPLGVGLDNLQFGDGPAPAPPVNDECAGRLTILAGSTPFSTYEATPSATPWSCGAPDGGDVWFEYTGVNPGWQLVVETCDTQFDTTVEVHVGGCAPQPTVACNDDGCGSASRVVVPSVVAGQSYVVRVGGYRYPHQSGTLRIREEPRSVPLACVESYFASDDGVAPGGVVYFDLRAEDDLLVSALELNTSTVGPVGLAVYTVQGSYANQTCSGCSGAWTLAATDDGASVGLGTDLRTTVTFAQPWLVPRGNWGVALVGRNPATNATLAHRFRQGTGANAAFRSADGMIRLEPGTATDVAWSGAGPVTAIWNGRLCATDPGTAMNSCVAQPNATGLPGRMTWSGSTSVASNSLVLRAVDLPNNSFCFFLTSQNRGFYPNAGGSIGNLCLAGAIGRFVGPFQIMNTGGTGAAALALDLAHHPTPTGLVPVAPGETWYFTLWFRDQISGQPYSNFTDRLRVQFQ